MIERGADVQCKRVLDSEPPRKRRRVVDMMEGHVRRDKQIVDYIVYDVIGMVTIHGK